MEESVLNDIAFQVMKKLSGLKYFYAQHLLGAIKAVEHENKYQLTQADRDQIVEKVKEAWRRLN